MNVLITGSTSGLGFEAGIMLLEKKHFVYFTTRTKKQREVLLEKLKEKGYQTGYCCFSLDIEKEKDRKKIINLPIDCLFCNGNMGLGGTLFDLSIDEIKNNFEVNVFSNLALIKLYLETSLEQKRFGKVVVTTSMAGLMPVPFMDSYSATKASLISFLTTLYEEKYLFSLPYSVKIIEPGIYQTGFNEYMFETVSENKYFKSRKWCQRIEKIFKIISKKSYHSITKKMVRAIESNTPKLIYRAPWIESFLLKLYLLLFK